MLKNYNLKLLQLKQNVYRFSQNELNKLSEKFKIIKTKGLTKDCNKSIVFLIVKIFILRWITKLFSICTNQ